MPPIESSDMRIGQNADLATTQDAQKAEQKPQPAATATSNAAGSDMKELMAMRRQRPTGVQHAQFVPSQDGTAEKTERPGTGLRRGLDNGALAGMNAMQQAMQMQFQAAQQRSQTLQQTSSEAAQLIESTADGMRSAAR
ncbi:hypothetical protein [Paraburkholderia phosphatilytica]|uniref:hypothetical protein n=1 Tax=Paraburkholderia phosphatilytica TaxID=2282883 RepID=UPI000F5D58D1|nr:hypothetical protein [Paraburkholderia phosphatilytica]